MEWISDDALALRAFLETATGVRLLKEMANRRPGFLSDEASGEASFARSRTIAGYELCLAELIELSHPVPEPEQERENMPDLDDDTKWPPSVPAP